MRSSPNPFAVRVALALLLALGCAAPASADYINLFKSQYSAAAGGDLCGYYPNPGVCRVDHVTTGTLAVGNGGTGMNNSTPGRSGLVLGQASTIDVLNPATSYDGACILSAGASADPTAGFCTQGITVSAAAQTSDATVSVSNTYVDVPGTSLSLAAGTWMIYAFVTAGNTSAAGHTDLARLQLTDASNNVQTEQYEGAVSGGAGGANARISLSWMVTPGSTTTYKLRFTANNTNVKAGVNTIHGSGTPAGYIVAVKYA